jgi:hypothetical protein
VAGLSLSSGVEMTDLMFASLSAKLFQWWPLRTSIHSIDVRWLVDMMFYCVSESAEVVKTDPIK